jgi:hypothetical protein
MRVRLLALVLLLAGCHADVDDRTIPSDHEIALLEARLAQQPCIGDLGGWERNYRYSRKRGLLSPHSLNPNLDVIEFHFRRAGSVSIEPGLKVLVPDPGGDWPDSAAIQSIEGRFTVSGNSLSLSGCKRRR